MSKETGTHVGTCKFCGQSQIGLTVTDDETDDQVATMSCKCEAGQIPRRMMLAEKSVSAKLKDFGGDTIEFARGIVKAVGNGSIDSATIKLNGSVKLAISLTSKDKISVTRTSTEVDKEEI